MTLKTQCIWNKSYSPSDILSGISIVVLAKIQSISDNFRFSLLSLNSTSHRFISSFFEILFQFFWDYCFQLIIIHMGYYSAILIDLFFSAYLYITASSSLCIMLILLSAIVKSLSGSHWLSFIYHLPQYNIEALFKSKLPVLGSDWGVQHISNIPRHFFLLVSYNLQLPSLSLKTNFSFIKPLFPTFNFHPPQKNFYFSEPLLFKVMFIFYIISLSIYEYI